jgi:hypothetical protein
MRVARFLFISASLMMVGVPAQYGVFFDLVAVSFDSNTYAEHGNGHC